MENLRRATDCGIAVTEDALQLAQPDAWVDALFGTGLTRAPGGAEKALIGRINADHTHGARVYAADIPSGLNGETGAAEVVAGEAGCAVRTLDMAISNRDYFAAMRQNIDIVKEALG